MTHWKWAARHRYNSCNAHRDVANISFVAQELQTLQEQPICSKISWEQQTSSFFFEHPFFFFLLLVLPKCARWKGVKEIPSQVKNVLVGRVNRSGFSEDWDRHNVALERVSLTNVGALVRLRRRWSDEKTFSAPSPFHLELMRAKPIVICAILGASIWSWCRKWMHSHMIHGRACNHW